MTPPPRQRPGRLRIDPALRSAAGRLLRLWRPMAGWSLLVWAVVALALTPLSSGLLSWSWLRGGETVVANEALLAWALTPGGLTWLVLAGSLALVGTVLHFAGVFRIVTDDLEGRRPSIAATALGLAPLTPALARFCATAVAAGLVAALPLAGGLAGVHRVFLAGRDINYYLAEQPAAWWWATGSAAVWTVAWTAGVAWLAGRSVLALPAYLDGHRGLVAAVRRSWRGTRGEGVRVVRVAGLAVAAWLAVRALVDAGAVVAGTAVVGWTAAVSDSLRVLLAATGGWAVVALLLDAAVAFLGIAWVSTVLSKLYHEDTELHRAGGVPGLEGIPARVGDFVQRWTRPTRLVPALAVAMAVSTATGALLLERVPDPRPVAVIAHRAGPPPAPENTMAALEAAVEAGADWSEVDVQLTRDSVPVLVHDADLLRVAGDRRRVSEVPHREIRDLVQGRADDLPAEERRILALGEFLDRADGRIGVAVELKYYGRDPRLARHVARVLRGRDDDDRVMVMSLDLEGVRQFREAAPGVSTGWAAAAAAVGSPTRLDVDFLALSRSAASAAVVRAARGAGIDVHVWTLNRADLMAEAIQMGADGIITDRPRLAVEVREELADLPAVSRLLLRFGHLLIEEPDAATPAAEL